MSDDSISSLRHKLTHILKPGEAIEWTMQAPTWRHWTGEQGSGSKIWAAISLIFPVIAVAVGVTMLWIALYFSGAEFREIFLEENSTREQVFSSIAFTAIASIFLFQSTSKLFQLRRSHYVLTTDRSLMVQVAKSCKISGEVSWSDIRLCRFKYNDDGTGDLKVAAKASSAFFPDQSKSYVEFFGVENPAAVEKLCYALRTQKTEFEKFLKSGAKLSEFGELKGSGETTVWSHRPSFYAFLESTGELFQIPFLLVCAGITLTMISFIPQLVVGLTSFENRIEFIFSICFTIMWSGLVLFGFASVASSLKSSVMNLNPVCLLTDKRVLNIFSRSRSKGIQASGIRSFQIDIKKDDSGIIRMSGQGSGKAPSVVFAAVPNVLRVEHEIAKLRGLT